MEQGGINTIGLNRAAAKGHSPVAALQPAGDILETKASGSDNEGKRPERGSQSPPVLTAQVSGREQLHDPVTGTDRLHHLARTEHARNQQLALLSGDLLKLWVPDRRHGVGQAKGTNLSKGPLMDNGSGTKQKTGAASLQSFDETHPAWMITPGNFHMPQSGGMQRFKALNQRTFTGFKVEIHLLRTDHKKHRLRGQRRNQVVLVTQPVRVSRECQTYSATRTSRVINSS